MLGAIIGDIVGSRFEFNNTDNYNFELFTEESTFTDDTICTSIEVGKKGDFVVLNTDNYHFLPYYVGMNCVNTTIKGGVLYPVL